MKMKSSLGAVLLATLATAQLPQQPLVIDDYPWLRSPSPYGFGTWLLDRKNTTEAVSFAIQTGYRHIDGAAAYGNEDLVGAGIIDGIAKAGIRRSDVWVTSKLWNDHHAPHLVPVAFQKTLSDLNLTYIDAYLMHFPVAEPPSTKEIQIDYSSTWRAMSALLLTGKVRYIGIANFSPDQLDDLMKTTGIKPHLHQMELHPYLQQNDWISYHNARGILVTAYSPLAGTNPVYDPDDDVHPPEPLLKNPTITRIAKKRNCTPAQVALAWAKHRGVSSIPKTSHKERIIENYDSWKCRLSDKDIHKINALGAARWRYSNNSKAWNVTLYEGLEGV